MCNWNHRYQETIPHITTPPSYKSNTKKHGYVVPYSVHPILKLQSGCQN